MRNQHTENARKTFAFIVPVTCVAFIIAIFSSDAIRYGQHFLNGYNGLVPTAYDYVGMIGTCVGVFMFNWFEELPTAPSLQKLMTKKDDD